MSTPSSAAAPWACPGHRGPRARAQRTRPPPLGDLFNPAIAIAENGFEISPRLAQPSRATRRYRSFPTPPPISFPAARNSNRRDHQEQAYADTLRLIAEKNADGYRGPVWTIVNAVKNARASPSI
jgi:gamma-glutamyltranspeptidase